MKSEGLEERMETTSETELLVHAVVKASVVWSVMV